MQKYLILAQSELTATALTTWLEMLGGHPLPAHDPCPPPIIIGSNFFDKGSVHAYQTLVKVLSGVTKLNEEPGSFESILVLVDSVRPSQLSAVTERSTWEHLLAMLILTFPEIRWAFGVFLGDHSEWSRAHADGTEVRFPRDEHGLASQLSRPPCDSLFDPTGLREWVKAVTNDVLTALAARRGKFGYRLPERQALAAVIDEEAEFAHLHAYAAYRYGFRSAVITSWEVMKDRFGHGGGHDGSHRYSLILEDMRLNFPDKPGEVKLSRLAQRADFCPLLDDNLDTARWRFLITTGQMGSDKELVNENKAYLERKTVGRGEVLYKPLGGIADLWEQMGLFSDLSEGGRPGNAPGFVWPPEFDVNVTYEGHGSPGKLSLIATTLLWRANAIKKNANSAPELVRGAVLASDAVELLGGKTPTLTFSAISLKNEFEVGAECEFMGAGYHFGLKTRLKELDDEVASVTRWYHENVRRRSALEAKAKVLNRLVIVFREAGRMEEELDCLAALRRLNRKLSAPKNVNPLAWVVYGLLSYGEWLLASFPRLLMLILFWLVVFVAAAQWMDAHPSVGTATQVVLWFGGEPYTKNDDAWSMQILSWFVVMTGIFHIGVLISYLYSLISRK